MKVVIVNPVAGNGKAKKIYKKLRNHPSLKNEAIFYITRYKGHTRLIIEEIETAKDHISILFIIGGDGTIHETVNALTNKRTFIAYIPGGSGNDFSRAIGSYKRPDDIITSAIQRKKTAQYWLSMYETEKDQARKLINCIGFGFDAIVSYRASKLSIRHILSKLRLNSLIYLFALLRELFLYKPRQITATIDGVEYHFNQVLFFTVNNQPFMGGGMKINPSAQNNDQYFSIIVVESIPKWKVFLLFGTVFFGLHTHFKGVHIIQAQEVTVTSPQRLPYQVDGEYGETTYAFIKKNNDSVRITGMK